MLESGDVERVDSMVNAANYHDEWYSWQRIREALKVVERKTAHNKASQKLRDLIKELMDRPTISTTQVLVVLYAEFPELQA